MLSNPALITFLPTVKPQEAKRFYNETLGLELVFEDDYALEFKSQGASLRITVVHELIPHPFTVMGFKIEDILTQTKALIDKGVKFETFDTLEQDSLGIWTSPSKAKIAWFKDPDGNLLSLTQLPKSK